MFKKTKVRQILELLHKDLSAREISKTLNVSRNSVAFVKESYDKCVTRPRQNRHLKRKDSIRFLVFLTFSSIQADRRIFSAPVMAVWLFIQKQLCCFRICLMLPVVFLRRQIAVCFVDTLPVIKYPYILEHCGFGFLPCPEMLPVEPFLL